jgi:probable HAF family extracellular repeat protein
MSPTRFALAAGLAAATLLPSLAMAQASAYSLTFLNNTLGGDRAQAVAINNQGQIAGTVTDNNAVDMFGTTYSMPRSHAVVWSPSGALTDLGAYTSASGINNQGQVIGSTAVSQAWYGSATVWNGTTATTLGLNAEGRAINDAGQAVGITYALDHSAYSGISATGWNGAAAMPSLGGPTTQVYDINASGTAVGSSQINTCTVYCSDNGTSAPAHATVWHDGSVTDLGLLAGGTNSAAGGINDQGVIVGSSNASDGLNHAVEWGNAGLIDLGVGAALKINNAGLIVGSSGGHATLWNGTTGTDLNSMVSLDPGWVLAWAGDINDVGQIIGAAYNAGLNVYKPFLLTPSAVPEPGTFGLTLLGLVGLGQIARRRKAA